ncbi:MAG: DUF4419 domain-containing protein [Chitinophagales bacterium]
MNIFPTTALTILFTFFFSSSLFAQPGRTFDVCEVEIAENLLPERNYSEVMDNLIVSSKERISPWEENKDSKGVKRSLLAYPQKGKKLVKTYNHPFAEAIKIAYAQHRPLVFSPDMVWMLICQGVATHIDQNSEQLRGQLVAHEGKHKIHIERNYYMANSVGYWENILGEFSDSIQAHVGEKMHGLISNRFSTTSSIEATAFEVTLMDAMSSYFSYSMGITCGIPSITLEGTVEDWEKLERDFEAFSQYDLKWWVDDLKPILHEFTQAARGEVDKEFWGKIYDYRHFERGMCGSPEGTITGWMLKFYPYLADDSKNPLIGKNLEKYSRQISKQKGYKSGQPVLELSDFPKGLSKADFILSNLGDVSEMEFLAGFVGIAQDSKTKALRPEINWSVVDSGRKSTSEESGN